MYDFTTTRNRTLTGSSKWLKMYEGGHVPQEGVIPMTVADMEFLPPEEITDALCRYSKSQILGYSRETPLYRKSVCQFMEKYHHYQVQPEWIVTTPGVVPSLANAVAAFSEEGDGVLVMPPIYPPFYQVVQGQGRVAELCPLQLKEGRYEMDFERFETLAKKPQVKLFLLCNPHNPGGRMWSAQELRQLADICLDHGVLMVSDEIHADIMLGESQHHVLGSIGPDIEQQSIICTAASKSFNIAGLQCANILIANEALREKFVEKNLIYGIERANVLGMVATMAAYEEGLDWLEEVTQVLRRNVEILQDFFNGYPNIFEMMMPEASFLVWVNFKGTGLSHEEFMELLKESECYVNSGRDYGVGGEFFIRINIGLPEKDLQANLRRLEQGLTARGIGN